jgi:hypothetical protein
MVIVKSKVRDHPLYNNQAATPRAKSNPPIPLAPDPKRELAPFPALTGAVVVAPGPVEIVVVAPDALLLPPDADVVEVVAVEEVE